MIRDFVARADAYGIDYNIIEAFDQPWKTNEGGVGAYWGLFDASREPKFSWVGPVSDPDHWKVAGLATLLGLLLSLTILAKPRATAGEAVTLAVATNAVGAWVAIVFAFWKGHYFVSGAAFALGFGMLLLVPLVADRARAHRRDRGDRVRPEAAPAADAAVAVDAGRLWHRRCRSTFRLIVSRRRC